MGNGKGNLKFAASSVSQGPGTGTLQRKGQRYA